MATIEKKPMSNGQLICSTIDKNKAQYSLVLPAHIPADRFIRTAQGAITGNPDLLKCTKQSLYLAVEQAAKDGLIIDGKQAAIVSFNKKSGDSWVKEAKYMPMTAGLMQLARNTGQVTTPVSEIVYENDSFLYHIKNGKVEIDHTPHIFRDRGKPIGVYSSCVIRGTDEVIAEVLTLEQVQSVRAQSKAKDSLMWTTFWEEGWKKSAFRRMFKRMPSSSDKEALDGNLTDASRFAAAATRDDDLYDFEGEKPAQDVHHTTDQPKQTKAAAAVAQIRQHTDEEVPFGEPDYSTMPENSNEDDII